MTCEVASIRNRETTVNVLAACFSRCNSTLEHSQAIHLHTLHSCFLTTAVKRWQATQVESAYDSLRNSFLDYGLHVDRNDEKLGLK